MNEISIFVLQISNKELTEVGIAAISNSEGSINFN
jgi:hypothetical protein